MKYVCKATGFWLSVVNAWARYNFCEPSEPDVMLSQTLWYNSNIRVNKRPAFINSAYLNGILYVRDLFVEGKIVSYKVFIKKYNDPGLTWLQYYRLTRAILTSWKMQINSAGDEETIIEANYEMLTEVEKNV